MTQITRWASSRGNAVGLTKKHSVRITSVALVMHFIRFHCRIFAFEFIFWPTTGRMRS